MRTITLLLLLLLLPAVGHAAGPINPSTVSVNAPTANADGSPLTDLKAIGFCVASSPTAPPLSCVDVASPTPSPTGAVVVSTPISAFNLTADGQYYLYANAVDLVANRGADTARAPFEWNRQAPAAPSLPTFP